ncbi:3'-5' exonuclease, partial [Trifolium medium]|nr:3'-5' exonuclease [Trifolium medium]
IAYALLEEQEGQKRCPDDYISLVAQYRGLSHVDMEEVQQDPNIWTNRPLSEQMIYSAADDVRFLLYIHQQMMPNLTERSLWQLAVRSALYCRCFCVDSNDNADWPSLPPVPDILNIDGNGPEEEILSVLDVPPEKMEALIMAIKESCNAEILIGGPRGPPNKVFIIGPVKQVKKAEDMLRGGKTIA